VIGGLDPHTRSGARSFPTKLGASPIRSPRFLRLVARVRSRPESARAATSPTRLTIRVLVGGGTRARSPRAGASYTSFTHARRAPHTPRTPKSEHEAL
jgi:hypothetical protein